MGKKRRILICGILPPPNFGHSMMYQMLMNSRFVETFDVIFLNMHFWSYGKHKKITIDKLLKFVKYYVQFILLVLTKRPGLVLYNMSFYKMPFLKDVLFCFTGRLLGCRYVIHDMGKYVRELYEESSSMKKKILKRYLDWAQASIVQGEYVREYYETLMSHRKLWVVPCAVEDTKSLNVQTWEKNGKINILYFSFLSEAKGAYTAFSAVPHVLEKNKNINFIFAGPVESDVAQKGLNALLSRFPDNTKYLGYIDNTLKRTECFRNADIFIFPTKRETFGLVILHAMAEGLPIIASTEGAIAEIIKDGENGFLITKGDDGQLTRKILQLADDQPLQKRMGEANRKKYLDCYLPQEYERKMITTMEGISQACNRK